METILDAHAFEDELHVVELFVDDWMDHVEKHQEVTAELWPSVGLGRGWRVRVKG